MNDEKLFIQILEPDWPFTLNDYDGFVINNSSPIIDNWVIDLSKYFDVPKDHKFVEGITIVYCVLTDANKAVVAYVAKNATFYSRCLFRYFEQPVCIIASSENSYVVPEDKREYYIDSSFDNRFITDKALSEYIKKISVPEYCVKFDESIIERGLREAGNDIKKLTALFDEVFDVKQQFRKSKPIIEKMIKLSSDWETTYRYANYLYCGVNTAESRSEAMSIYKKLLGEDQRDEILIRMGLYYEAFKRKSEAMVLFEQVRDKSKFGDFYLDYELLKKSLPWVSNVELYDEKRIIKHSVFLPFNKINVDGVSKFYDPIKKTDVQVTPEEKVRQQVLRYLLDDCGVPEKYIKVEDSLAHYDKGNALRADITVRVSDIPLLVVECKENNISIDGDPLRQLLNYNKTIRSKYLLLTNGNESFIYMIDDNETPVPLSALPTFDEMQKNLGNVVPVSEMYRQRTDVSEFTPDEISYEKADARFLGADTPDELCPVILNLAWFFMDESYKIENIKGCGCEIVRDCGINYTKVGNQSGGKYEGEFRQLIVKDRHGREQRLCFSVFGTNGGYTSLICAIEINGHLESKLQIQLDKSLKKCEDGDIFTLTHNGVRSRRPAKATIDYVMSVCPELIENNKVFLGNLDNEKNLTISSPGMEEFMARLVAYVILRKELSLKETKEKTL